MKRVLLFLLLILPVTTLYAQSTTSLHRMVSGVVYDADSGEALHNVAVAVLGTNIGTVTNADGFFTLKVTADELQQGLKLTHVGYANKLLSAAEIVQHDGALRIRMKQLSLMMHEVTIYGGTARELVEAAIRSIETNYAPNESLFEAFHRETVQKRRSYIAVSEAVMDVYKTGYENRTTWRDKVRLRRGRRLVNHQASDTLAVKISGGPSLTLYMDLVKNGDELLNEKVLDKYKFTLQAPVILDNRPQHVIAIEPQVETSYALFYGRIFIDQARLSFTRIELDLDLSDRIKATNAMLQRRPAGLRFRPLGLSFLVTYRHQDGCHYLNYVRSSFRFRCEWKRRLFAAPYTAVSESVMVDREEHPEIIRNRDIFRKSQIFYDEVDAYADPDYWRDFNIIEPTESLEHAVERLRRHNNKE